MSRPGNSVTRSALVPQRASDSSLGSLLSECSKAAVGWAILCLSLTPLVGCAPAGPVETSEGETGVQSLLSNRGVRQCRVLLSIASSDETRAVERHEMPSWSYSTVDKQGETWLSVLGNSMAKTPRYSFWLGVPLPTAEGEVSADGGRTNYLTLNLIGDKEFSGYDSTKLNRDPGIFEVTHLEDEWIELHGKTLLSEDQSGDSLELDFEFAFALPPAQCP